MRALAALLLLATVAGCSLLRDDDPAPTPTPPSPAPVTSSALPAPSPSPSPSPLQTRPLVPLTHAELCDWAMDMAALFGGNPDPVQWERFAGEARKAADQELALIGDNMATAIRGADYARATNILERDLPAECPPQ